MLWRDGENASESAARSGTGILYPPRGNVGKSLNMLILVILCVRSKHKFLSPEAAAAMTNQDHELLNPGCIKQHQGPDLAQIRNFPFL